MGGSTYWGLAFAAMSWGVSAGCTAEEGSDIESFRQALPSADAMEIAGPETPRGSSGAPAAADASIAGPGQWAVYYALTREIRDGANAVTAGVLGTVWFIAHTNPTEVAGEQATWGPYTDALEPATWRFRMTHEGGGEYSYVLEGRPKTSDSDDDYRVVVSGVGFGESSDQHGDGSFTIDIDTGKELDPFAYEAKDSGKLTVVHDLPPTVTEELNALPRTLDVQLAPSSSSEHLDIRSEARADGTGLLIIDGFADIDDSKETALEALAIVSQWDASGSGRADVTVTGGDVPVELSSLAVVECWDASFRRSYYTDSVGFEETVGEAASCPYTEAPAED